MPTIDREVLNPRLPSFLWQCLQDYSNSSFWQALFKEIFSQDKDFHPELLRNNSEFSMIVMAKEQTCSKAYPVRLSERRRSHAK